MKNYRLHLVRHGLTQANIEGVYVGGGLDVPLCEAGIKQLEEMAARFTYPAPATVFCSPMRRALETAELLFPDVSDKIVLEDLRENVFGEFEGRKVDELVKDPDFAKWLDPESHFVPAGGESGQDFAARTAGALRAMLEHMMRNGIGEAACVTHGGVIMSMMGQMALPQKPPRDWMADNGAGYTVQANAAMLMRDGLVEAVAILPPGYLDR